MHLPNWPTLNLRTLGIWPTTGAPDLRKALENCSFRVIGSQSTLIHKTAISG
jgi:hypothetical protein